MPHRLLKALAEGRLARQQRYFLGLDPALRTAQSIKLDHYRRAVFEARQIPYLPLVDLGNFMDPSTTAGTLQFAVPALASLSLILLSVLKNPLLENPR